MSADVVWVSSGPQAETFHLIPEGRRRTSCGRFTGPVVDGRPAEGQLVPRTDAAGRECRTCFGMAERRQPIVEGRRNSHG